MNITESYQLLKKLVFIDFPLTGYDFTAVERFTGITFAVIFFKFDIMDANIQNKKIELIQWLSTLNDISVIEKIMKLRERERSDWWNEISDAEKKSIEKGLEDVKSGNVESHAEVKKIYEKWL